MSVINQTKKYELTLVAISTKDKLNKNHKKCGEFFTDGKTIYWPLCDCVYLPSFNHSFLSFMHNQKNSINVDINSFLSFFTKPEDKQAVLNAIFSADAFTTEKYSLKTINKTPTHQHNFIVDLTKYGKFVKVAQVSAEAESFAKKLMDMPGNYLTADNFEKIIKSKFQGMPKIKLSVLHNDQLLKKKMGLITAVGQVSPKENKPRIIVVEYNNAPKKNKLALVGKGLTFDTGGLNLKPGEFMTGMHMDMSGAAITLANIYALAKLKIETNVVGVATITSNDIGPHAYRVNDVLTSYDGRTVEILNTDAEGRLALADGITYAKRDLKANTIVTVATLTGAILVALGDLYTGIWATDEAEWAILKTAAEQAPELIWRMPLHDVFQKEIINNSRIADMANISAGRKGSSNTAAEFLNLFAKDTNFIHADIAGSTEFKKQSVPALFKTLFNFAKAYK